MRTRDEHLAWAKARALEYLNRGELQNAFASMGSDLRKHEELNTVGVNAAIQLGILYVMQRDAHELRRWIEGFQ